MKRFVFLFVALCLFLACRKETTTPTPDPDPNPTPPIGVPIYLPGDTSLGAGYAKKQSADWASQVICAIHSAFDTNFIALTCQTYTSKHLLKESLNFVYIPRSGENKIFGLKKMTEDALVPGFISATYTTWKLDGNLPEDNYRLDPTATDNFFKPEKIDIDNKRIEGSFTATFKIVEPRFNEANPQTVKFSDGKFWAVIRD